jgi:hypothetical protein
VLAEALRDEPDWRGVLRVEKIEVANGDGELAAALRTRSGMRGLSSTEWRNGGQDGASGSAPNPHVRKDLGRHLRLLGQQAVPIDDRRGHVHDVAVRRS